MDNMKRATKSGSKSAPSLTELLEGIIPPDLWRHVVDDIRSAGSAWHPLDSPGMPSELGRSCPEELDDMVRTGRKDDRTAALAQWVNRATWTESQNQSRLSTLLWALRCAIEAGDHPAMDRLKSFMRNEYGVNRFEMSALEARQFCQSATRNFKACPRDWRRVGWGLDDPKFRASQKIVKAPAPAPFGDW